MRVLVTGAAGFVGSALVPALRADGHVVVRAVRCASSDEDIAVDVGPNADWSRVLSDVEAVVHLAAPAHRRAAAALYQDVTVEGTRVLAEQAARAGVRRFVLLSSVLAREPSTYGRAKAAAENIVLAQTGLESIALRAPLLFGPGAKANAKALLRLADSPLPLPFAGFSARRNVMALSTLVAVIQEALAQRIVGVYDVADQPSLTIGELVSALREGLGRPRRLLAAPTPAPAAFRTPLEIDDSPFRAAVGYGDFSKRSAANALADAARAWKTARRET